MFTLKQDRLKYYLKLSVLVALLPLYVEVCNILYHYGNMQGSLSRYYANGVCEK